MSDKMKLVYNQYDNGGARFYFEGEKPKKVLGGPKRDLIADVYQDEEFALYIKECIEEYFELNKQEEA